MWNLVQILILLAVWIDDLQVSEGRNVDRVLEDAAGAGLVVGHGDLAGRAGGLGVDGEGGAGVVDAVISSS